MGRHTTPGTGAPDPDRGFWLRVSVAVLVVVLVGAYLLVRSQGDDDTTTATPPGKSSPPTPSATTATPREKSSPPTPAARSSSDHTAMTVSTPPFVAPGGVSAGSTSDPPTLRFVVLREAYITVRIPGGRTLVSRLFPRGARASFNQKTLQVVNGRPSAVRFTVNGHPRQPGPAEQTETFTVHRR